MKKLQEVILPRQFMDLGRSAGAAETDKMSHSDASEERTQSAGSPPINNVEVGSKIEVSQFDHHQETSSFRDDAGKRVGREESPESDGWGPNKVQKLNPAAAKPNIDHQSSTEATMRKARVSVRARSEAPMVYINVTDQVDQYI